VMGGDDILRAGSLTAQVAVLEADAAVALVTGPRVVITEKGHRIMRRGNGTLKGRVDGAMAGREMIRRGSNLVGEPCATLFRASSVRAVGPFDETAPYCIDMEMWLRLLETGDLYVLDTPVCEYRIVGSSWSAAVAAEQDADVIRLIEAGAARGAFGSDASDAARGAHRARRLRGSRQLLYRVLWDSGTREKLLYLVIGGWNTLFGYLAFSALYFLLHTRLTHTPILVASYVISTLNAYWGYKLVVFRTTGRFLTEFPRFAMVYVFALAANIIVFPWLTKTLGLNPYLSQAIFTVALVICTYVANKRFAFKKAVA
jgi:putative flippase GtrA